MSQFTSPNTPGGQPKGATGPAINPTTFAPTGGEGFGSESLSTPKKRISTQQVALLGMVALGGAALWGMRQHGLQAGMTFAAPAIEYQPPSADKGQQASQQRVLAALERTGMHAQVPAEKFDRNPFSTGIKKTVATAGMPTDESNDDQGAREAALEEQKLQERLALLQVQGVMGGRVPLARINGAVHRTGDVLDKVFKIKSIDGRSVVIEYPGVGGVGEPRTVTLTMNEPKDNAPAQGSAPAADPGRAPPPPRKPRT